MPSAAASNFFRCICFASIVFDLVISKLVSPSLSGGSGVTDIVLFVVLLVGKRLQAVYTRIYPRNAFPVPFERC
ncbi:uncharacterized protein EV420DRAFT_1603104 [Desarmillaria tabescens]|uniref:Uncharacterized protein n=1 Tax=Armillaria tabescens TaxID=1929756 RepID=A0AA39IYK1_ARMTA|nr:uncharacterized protein EV420DRAFT_1603104 [Desarmillaria tabescens]KAK0432818.1 hypothetical protein EV420DRAFT_1603104 [Desarmillaria tabescens]